jgi:ubiquinone/menaquinone biosynthesis C-methylase UbiE
MRASQPVGARYDGVAHEYERIVTDLRAEHHAGVGALAADLLGPPPPGGRRRLVDLGCGPGVVSARFRPDWHVTGLDVSAQQLSLARSGGRVDVLVHADASRAPLCDGYADAVVSTYTHTDVDDWPALVAEAARLLRAGGLMVYVGPHTCFVGPHAEHSGGSVIHHPGYYHSAPILRFSAPGLPPPERGGLRARVGVRHLTLTRLLAPFTETRRWQEWRLVESADDPPTLLGVRAVRR